MTKPFLAYSEALYLKPLLYGLEGKDTAFRRVVDFPATVALNMSKRIQLTGAGCAFLSPIDYARHGAEYCIIPRVAVSSTEPTSSIELYVKSDIRSIRTMAVDIRVTSEIILAKIILMEKYRHADSKAKNLQVVPMMPNVKSMLARADAALVVNFSPSSESQSDFFKVDLVEEWNDLTDLPYLHGFWVGRQEELLVAHLHRLMRAKATGVSLLNEVASKSAAERGLSQDSAVEYLSSFSYDLGELQTESLQELMSYAYYFGSIPDIPEVNFFDVEDPTTLNSN